MLFEERKITQIKEERKKPIETEFVGNCDIVKSEETHCNYLSLQGFSDRRARMDEAEPNFLNYPLNTMKNAHL